MTEIKFHPNLTDPKVMLGVIYMTSDYNVYKVVEVVNHYLNCNPDDKIVYDYFVQTVSYCCKENALSFLASMFFNVSKGYNEFLKKLLNESFVIEAIRSSKVRIFERDNAYIIAKSFIDIFKHENVLEILQSWTPRSIFVTFGYHPAIASNIELQKKWITIVAEDPMYAIREIPWYITDEALEIVVKTDLEKVVAFIEEFFGDENYKKEKIALFSEDMLKKIIALYIISGDSTRGKKLLSKVKAYAKQGLLSKPKSMFSV